ncbi:MAG: lipid A biosynthesis acyltransferase [Planctomycetaceae bacterium]|nr:lipid A biosynthesis acyltransferase [Planctomycetaceae bacterium]
MVRSPGLQHGGNRALLDLIAYCGVRLVVAVLQTLPIEMGDSLCRGLARLVAGPLKVRKRVIEENLERIFPGSDDASRHELAYRMWHHLLLMVCEIAWAQRRLHRSNWSQHVTFRGNRTMLKHMLSERPVVVVTGHFGNFEIGGYTSGLMGFSTLTIARKLDNAYLHRWVEAFRGAKGAEMVDKQGCAPTVERRLQEGGMLSLLADQHAGSKGCWVDFLGVPASCHKALSLFTLTSSAPMLVAGTRRTDKPMQFEFFCTGVADPQDDPEGICRSVNTLTAWYNQRLAEVIEEGVEQYWWLHRRWRTPPPRIAKRLEKRLAA